MNSIFTGRECRGKYYAKREDGTSECKEFDSATFIGFGDDYEEFESGPAQYTTAIVVLPDGRVTTTAPEFIQFITKKSKKPDKPLSRSVEAIDSTNDEMIFYR